ncbi:uncharacterized protein LOC116214946 [Punica granatum]|uniref:Uncharacterized protein LOC116214946 n=1 Tax=Punica granatum TaxID=22663 RepID=A0A6P8EHW6_PUNGR|nr:uncharacterized protein LOC116214946 [Punica granatum]
MWVVHRSLDNLRGSTIVLGISNAVVLILGASLLIVDFNSCGHHNALPFAAVTLASAVRIAAMVNTAIAQEATAQNILGSPESSVVDTAVRIERRVRYKKWIWWTRFATIITVLQFVGAIYLLVHMYRSASHQETANECLLGVVSRDSRWEKNMLAVFVIMVCVIAIIQCFAGSDVLRWRSFYVTEDKAWKAHYREVFDLGMREALCCLGRSKYLSASEEDEVYSVAQVLGDLVAYRASGTGHLELLTGLALFQRHVNSPKSDEGLGAAPRGQMEEAASLHRFAEAAYTGPLLDVGRNPFSFPCAWAYRQGILTPWSRNRRPKLKGDNWWRGHAAAFLKYLHLAPDALRKGRVSQRRCEAAYFIVVLHDLQTVVIAVRGTETPEDLLTDGLCKECPLSSEDLDGLINSNQVKLNARQDIESSFPHYGHSGIVEAVRDLFLQIDGSPVDDSGDIESTQTGFLSSLMGSGCECDGYSIRIVGHSLGGSIASMLGIRLYHRYPNLHVYTYGSLPCVDLTVANSCTEFITSIVYDNEFSARLSVGSVLRLRAAALRALSQDQKTDNALIFRLAHQFLFLNKYLSNRVQGPQPIEAGEYTQNPHPVQYKNEEGGKKELDNVSPLLDEAGAKSTAIDIDSCNITSSLEPDDSTVENSLDDPVSEFLETVPEPDNSSDQDPAELFIPGLVIHIVPKKNNFLIPMWRGWGAQETAESFRVYVADRQSFRDMVVCPSMFLDHLPWRCRNALHKILANQDLGLQSE